MGRYASLFFQSPLIVQNELILDIGALNFSQSIPLTIVFFSAKEVAK